MAKQVIKTKGVKLGTKRGAYKKTIKTNLNEEITKKQNTTKFGEVVKRVQSNTNDNDIKSVSNEGINTPLVSNEDKPEILNDNSGANDKGTIDGGGTFIGTNESEAFQQTTGEESLNSFLSEYKQIEENETQQQSSKDTNNNTSHTSDFTSSNNSAKSSLAMLVNGYMLLTMCDFVFPFALKFLFGLFNKDAKQIKTKDIQLTSEQRDGLMAAADQVAAYVFEKANPLVVFVLCMGGCYASNLSTSLSEVKNTKA